MHTLCVTLMFSHSAVLLLSCSRDTTRFVTIFNFPKLASGDDHGSWHDLFACQTSAKLNHYGISSRGRSLVVYCRGSLGNKIYTAYLPTAPKLYLAWYMTLLCAPSVAIFSAKVFPTVSYQLLSLDMVRVSSYDCDFDVWDWVGIWGEITGSFLRLTF